MSVLASSERCGSSSVSNLYMMGVYAFMCMCV